MIYPKLSAYTFDDADIVDKRHLEEDRHVGYEFLRRLLDHLEQVCVCLVLLFSFTHTHTHTYIYVQRTYAVSL